MKRSTYAKVWLALWGLVTLFTGYLVIRNPDLISLGQWDAQHLAILLGLLLLIPAAILMHKYDIRYHGGGFKDVHRSPPKTLMNVDDAAVSGMLTVQSIRAVMTLGMLVALMTWQREIAGEAFKRPLVWPSVFESPTAIFFSLVAAFLAVSAVTTLAALLCYDYSLRFDWDQKPNMKLALRRKAHRLGVIGFYCLMWSLAAATSLLDPYVCLVATTGVFIVMWDYYFFGPDVLFPAAKKGCSFE